MEENNFEKQVQKKMDELKIQPSEAVWEKIEAQIEKKRSPRRWGLLLLFFFFLIGGAYLLWNLKQHQILESPIAEKDKIDKINKFSKDEKKYSEEASNSNNNGTVIRDSVIRENTVTNENLQENEVDRNSVGHYKFSSAKKIKATIISGEQSGKLNSFQKESSGFVARDINSKSEFQNSIVDSIDFKTGNETVTKPGESNLTVADEIKEDSISEILPEKIITKTTDIAKQELAGKKVEKKLAKNKWEFGIVVSGGISNLRNNNINTDKASPVALNNADPGSAYVSIPFLRNNFESPALNNGFGFTVGAFAEKDISKKSSFVLGLNFKSFTTKNDVGTANYLNGMYNNAQSFSSTNKSGNYYNYIEIPLTLKFQINKGKVVPLFWEGGLAVSELISSNALQFDATTGNYYNDNSLFNKTQFGLNTALSLSLFSKQKTSVLIGPHFYYDATKIANKGWYDGKHFVYIGVQARVVFGK